MQNHHRTTAFTLTTSRIISGCIDLVSYVSGGMFFLGERLYSARTAIFGAGSTIHLVIYSWMLDEYDRCAFGGFLCVTELGQDAKKHKLVEKALQESEINLNDAQRTLDYVFNLQLCFSFASFSSSR